MTPTAYPDLSVILVNWNSLEVTSRAISSVQAQTRGISYEVILVDNGTDKDSSPVELPQRFPAATFIANPDNRGFSKANNQGMKLARGRYVLLLNSDTIQIENALGAAVGYMDAHTDVGALGIRHLNNDAGKTVQPSFFAFPNPWLDVLSLLGLIGLRSPAALGFNPLTEQDVDWVCGSFLLMRRECLAQVGALDEQFFIYSEDIDWCLHARQAGWKVRFWPGAAMIHVGSASHPHMRDKTFAHFRSNLTYIRKNHSLLAAGTYYTVMCLRLTGTTFVQAIRYVVGRASKADVRERYERLRQFLFLHSSRMGC